ncbi:MAG: hypothetical protein KGY56_01610 [Desulfobacterales bacterium]|nr:hypothetical protein [Desulfobacterales bacterium]
MIFSCACGKGAPSGTNYDSIHLLNLIQILKLHSVKGQEKFYEKFIKRGKIGVAGRQAGRLAGAGASRSWRPTTLPVIFEHGKCLMQNDCTPNKRRYGGQ